VCFKFKDTKSSIKVLLSMGDEAAVLLDTMSNSEAKIGHAEGRFKAGARTVSGSVKYFIEMLIEAEAQQQSSLNKKKSTQSIAVAADFLNNMGEDGEGPGQVSDSYFPKPQSKIPHANFFFVCSLLSRSYPR
jgi:rhodanese-related sulfurtransferase